MFEISIILQRFDNEDDNDDDDDVDDGNGDDYYGVPLILPYDDLDHNNDMDPEDDDDHDEYADEQAAAHYGVPLHLLFQPDDLAVQAHVYKYVFDFL